MNEETRRRTAHALEEERDLLTRELRTIATPDREGAHGWVPSMGGEEKETAESETLASELEGFEDGSSVGAELSLRLERVREALERLNDGSYGVCRVCGSGIETERIEADPAAPTCKTHRDS